MQINFKEINFCVHLFSAMVKGRANTITITDVYFNNYKYAINLNRITFLSTHKNSKNATSIVHYPVNVAEFIG